MQRRIKQIQRWGVLRGWRKGDSDRGNPHKGGNAASHLKVLREGTTGKKSAAGELARAEAGSGECRTGRGWPGGDWRRQLEWSALLTGGVPSGWDIGRILKSLIIQATAVLKSDFKFGAKILKKWGSTAQGSERIGKKMGGWERSSDAVRFRTQPWASKTVLPGPPDPAAPGSWKGNT